MAKALAARGFDVGLFARNETYKGADKLTGLAREINALKAGRAFPVVMDASNAEDVRNKMQLLLQQSGASHVHVLIYNAVRNTSISRLACFFSFCVEVFPLRLLETLARWASRARTRSSCSGTGRSMRLGLF